MTKKDYKVIADAIAEWAVEFRVSKKQYQRLVTVMCWYLKGKNPRFDDYKFITYLNKKNGTKQIE